MLVSTHESNAKMDKLNGDFKNLAHESENLNKRLTACQSDVLFFIILA